MRFNRWQASRAVLAALALASGSLVAMSPAGAQDTDARLRKAEAEIKALQRQVFPGGDGKYFAPEVTSGVAVQQQPIGAPAETPLTDVLGRLDSIESQLARLTARSEVNENAIAMVQSRLDALEARGAATTPDAGSAQPTGAIPVPDADGPVADAKAPADSGTGARPRTARLSKVAAVAKPETGNAGDDEYSYGFRLWEAGLLPEAQQQLKLYVDKYPDDAKISYGRNLLGRAYLDDKQPGVAASYFLQNYQKDPSGARAADSLLFLAEAMLALKDSTRACRALDEFSNKYPEFASGRLQSAYDKDRSQAGCK